MTQLLRNGLLALPALGLSISVVAAPISDSGVLRAIEKASGPLIEQGQAATIPHLQSQLSAQKTTGMPIKSLEAKLAQGETLYERALQSTVAVAPIYNCGHCDNYHAGAASGFVIDQRGLVVTNYHVIEMGAADNGRNLAVMVRTADGQVYPVTEIVASSMKDDLAILKVDTGGRKLPAFPLASGVRVSETAHVISNPQHTFHFYAKGVVSRHYLVDSGDKSRIAGAERISITADYATGSSGAPVYNDHGEIIGVASQTSEKSTGQTGRKEVQMVVKVVVPVTRLRALFKS